MTRNKIPEGKKLLFSIKNLEYRYAQTSNPALVLSSFSLLEGECVAIVGSNGSGKTTVLKLLNFLLPDQNANMVWNTIQFRGQAYTKKLARQQTIYLHQHPYIFRGTVSHNVAIARATHHTTSFQLELLDILRLQNKAGHEARLLSGGEMQRVALARTIAAGKPILLLDEPTSGADSTSTEFIIAALTEIKKNSTIIFSTHSARAAEKLADRIVHLDKGKIISDRRSEYAEKSSSGEGA